MRTIHIFFGLALLFTSKASLHDVIPAEIGSATVSPIDYIDEAEDVFVETVDESQPTTENVEDLLDTSVFTSKKEEISESDVTMWALHSVAVEDKDTSTIFVRKQSPTAAPRAEEVGISLELSDTSNAVSESGSNDSSSDESSVIGTQSIFINSSSTEESSSEAPSNPSGAYSATTTTKAPVPSFEVTESNASPGGALEPSDTPAAVSESGFSDSSSDESSVIGTQSNFISSSSTKGSYSKSPSGASPITTTTGVPIPPFEVSEFDISQPAVADTNSESSDTEDISQQPCHVRDPQLTCTGTGNLSHPMDCHRYWTCSTDGLQLECLCPENTAYSKILGRCSRDIAHCNEQPDCYQDDYAQEFIMPDPSSHSSFYWCRKQRIGKPENFYYHKFRIICDYDQIFSLKYEGCTPMSFSVLFDFRSVKEEMDLITATGMKRKQKSLKWRKKPRCDSKIRMKKKSLTLLPGCFYKIL